MALSVWKMCDVETDFIAVYLIIVIHSDLCRKILSDNGVFGIGEQQSCGGRHRDY